MASSYDLNEEYEDEIMELLTSPSYHHISPLARSRSDVRASGMRRSNSFSGTLERTSSRSYVPSYGYGGGYMGRSLSRSGTSLFGRSLAASALTKTPPLHNVGVQRSTPHFTDKWRALSRVPVFSETAAGVCCSSAGGCKCWPTSLPSKSRDRF